MRIGELADASGVSTKTIRYYESIALLPEAERTSSGYRIYEPGMVGRIRFIRDAQSSGLSLAEIASVLELKDAGASSCQHTIGLVDRHLAELDLQIERLTETRHQLATMAERGRAMDPTGCTDPNRCQVIAGPDQSLDLPAD